MVEVHNFNCAKGTTPQAVALEGFIPSHIQALIMFGISLVSQISLSIRYLEKTKWTDGSNISMPTRQLYRLRRVG
ncbi:hypothetical protein DK842_22735 [Chromobacterium phragmitis]|nr:hypothetical protein DK842_22735 [Chromobacterium phragmitis]